MFIDHVCLYLSRWEMLDRPMHAAAYLVSPKYLDNTNALKVSEIQRGWFATISRLVPREKHALVTEQLHAFRDLKEMIKRV